MKEDIKIIIFELIFILLSFLIFIGIIICIIKEEYIYKDNNINNTFYTAEPIGENLTPPPATEEPVLTPIPTISCEPIEEVEEVKIEIYSNSYTDIINNLTDYEKSLIYKITFAEAGNQEVEGQRAVIEVILNRVLSEDFPNTVEGVLSQPHQFSTWAKRDKIRQVDQDGIIDILVLVGAEDPILPNTSYVFFDGKQHTKYVTNYIKIQDHWFGTQYN